jgi:salicylate hydroxylase
VRAAAFRPAAVSTRHHETSEPNFEGPFDDDFERRHGGPYLDLHRADLHGLLARAVGADGLQLGHKVVGASESPNSVRLRFADGSTTEADVLIGADGVHSAVRGSIHGDPGARFSGHVAYRGLVPAERIPGAIEPKLNIWVGPGRHFVAYFVRGGQLVNYVAVVEEDWRMESWTTPGDKRALARHFADWSESVRRLIDATPDEQCFKWALLVRDPLEAWSTERITLLGDAAHPMVPYLGQGANAAFEDAWLLAHCLASSYGLRRYEDLRRDRTRRIQEAAWEQGRLSHTVDATPFAGGNFSVADWIYGYDCVADYPIS